MLVVGYAWVHQRACIFISIAVSIFLTTSITIVEEQGTSQRASTSREWRGGDMMKRVHLWYFYYPYQTL